METGLERQAVPGVLAAAKLVFCLQMATGRMGENIKSKCLRSFRSQSIIVYHKLSDTYKY